MNNMQPRSTAFLIGPGAQALMACVVVDGLMGPLGALCGAGLSFFMDDRASRAFLGLLATGIVGAQISMLAIWLCVIAASLFWPFVALGALVVLLQQLTPTPVGLNGPSMSMLIASAFVATLPLAAINVAGFRVVPWETSLAKGTQDLPRFTLGSLFLWTFIVAAMLAVFHWLPATFGPRLDFLFSLLAISAIAVATLWAVLRPGPVCLRLVGAPTAVLLLAVFGTQRLLGWSAPAVPRLLATGVVYVVALASLLGIYRRAGTRLVHKTAGGWLVR